eukprot:3889006-Pleurochrysis_carterae.AAC.1
MANAHAHAFALARRRTLTHRQRSRTRTHALMSPRRRLHANLSTRLRRRARQIGTVAYERALKHTHALAHTRAHTPRKHLRTRPRPHPRAFGSSWSQLSATEAEVPVGQQLLLSALLADGGEHALKLFFSNGGGDSEQAKWALPVECGAKEVCSYQVCVRAAHQRARARGARRGGAALCRA